MIDLGVYDKMYVDGFFCRSDLNALVERLRQAEKDAARYRWLRDKAPDMDVASPLVIMADECGCVMDEDDDFCGILSQERLDSAIDEAMNGSNN